MQLWPVCAYRLPPAPPARTPTHTASLPPHPCMRGSVPSFCPLCRSPPAGKARWQPWRTGSRLQRHHWWSLSSGPTGPEGAVKTSTRRLSPPPLCPPCLTGTELWPAAGVPPQLLCLPCSLRPGWRRPGLQSGTEQPAAPSVPSSPTLQQALRRVCIHPVLSPIFSLDTHYASANQQESNESALFVQKAAVHGVGSTRGERIRMAHAQGRRVGLPVINSKPGVPAHCCWDCSQWWESRRCHRKRSTSFCTLVLCYCMPVLQQLVFHYCHH